MYYQRIKELIESGQLKLIGITSPARCASTALEVGFGSNSDCDALVNQPFGLDYDIGLVKQKSGENEYYAPENREEDAYAKILEQYNNQAALQPKKAPIILVVKEMTRNLGFGEMYDRYSSLLDKEILLIRNPYFSVPSAVEKLALPISKKRTDMVQHMNRRHVNLHTFDKVGTGEDWIENLLNITANLGLKNYGMAYDLNMFIPERLREFVDTLEDRHAFEIGYGSLDAFAYAADNCSWTQLKKRYLDNLGSHTSATECLDALKPFEPLFQDMLTMNETGWFHMAQLWERKIGQLNDNQIIVDSTILRTHRQEVLNQIFKFCAVSESAAPEGKFSDKARRQLAEEVAGNPVSEHMHKEVLDSKGIKEPNDKYPLAAELVYPMEEHIREIALPVYSAMLSSALYIIEAKRAGEVRDPQQQFELSKSANSWVSIITSKLARKASPSFGEAAGRLNRVFSEPKTQTNVALRDL